MINFIDVNLNINREAILKNINLNISERRVGIVGANGSGKSTLTKLIKGLVKATSGQIKVFDQDINKVPKRWHTKIGYVFQEPDHQIIMPVVQDDIAFGLKNLGLSKEQILSKVATVLSLYGLQEFRHKSSYNLSGGQKQLLAIAAVLAMEPELIIFDEPTTLLDLRNKNRIKKIIDDLAQAVILVTHDLELLHNFDRVVVLEEGRIIADDLPHKALKIYVDAMA